VRGWVSPDGIHFEVRDHGPGLDPLELDHLFECFYRGKGDNAGGRVGLGLAITKALVVAHEGTLSVESSPGHGAKFTVTLPSA
jgi:signal transduction histidine kinase